jgi:hypothetical protein
MKKSQKKKKALSAQPKSLTIFVAACMNASCLLPALRRPRNDQQRQITALLSGEETIRHFIGYVLGYHCLSMNQSTLYRRKSLKALGK